MKLEKVSENISKFSGLDGYKILSLFVLEKDSVKTGTHVDNEEGRYSILIASITDDGEPVVYSVCGSNITRPFLFKENVAFVEK